jgi:hypothetical protein
MISDSSLIIVMLFFSRHVALGASAVRQHDTLKMSDHLPVVATITLP